MTDNPLFTLLFIPMLPHTINLVSCMFYACLVTLAIGAIFERKK